MNFEISMVFKFQLMRTYQNGPKDTIFSRLNFSQPFSNKIEVA
jgi:hypothetical protein